MLPPPKEAPDAERVEELYRTVKQLQEQLVFPKQSDEPVLKLRHDPNGESSPEEHNDEGESDAQDDEPDGDEGGDQES